jgi:2-polyprenyl-3-methyl-5-hydroxy-6-metoxy-1,4-benzoquinol methylase
MIITESYKELNRQLHETNPNYGVSGSKWRDFARNLSDWGRKPILDYGCGKQTLAKSLGPAYHVTGYDPCIPGLDTTPEPHPIVICGDVMEHVEPEYIEPVLKQIRELTKEKAFFVIALGPSQKTLADGRNSHISQHDADWWRGKLIDAGFTIAKEKPQEKGQGATWFTVQ